MKQRETNNDTEARRFLLGEMSAGERVAFEEVFVADEARFEQTRVVEDELIESYVRGTLSAVEREKFESSFLTTQRRRKRVAFTRTMLDKLTQQRAGTVAQQAESAGAIPFGWDSITGFFKTPKLAFGVALALLVLIFGGWLLLRKADKIEIVQQPTPTPTIQKTPPNQYQTTPANQPELVNTNTPEKPPDNRNGSPTANRETPILALFAGTVRAEGKMSELNLPKSAAGANLQLNLESDDYQIYRVEIVAANGNLVFRNNNLKTRNSKISLFVPAAKLQGGDYLVRLSALNPRNETESVADYPFRVNRK